MTKNTKLVWRLGKLPSPDEVRELVKDKIITNEEAREILFSSETEEDKNIKDLEAEVKFLKEEVKFLKEVIVGLNTSNVGVREVIRYIEKPYVHNPWWNGTFMHLCNNGLTSGAGISNLTGDFTVSKNVSNLIG